MESKQADNSRPGVSESLTQYAQRVNALARELCGAINDSDENVRGTARMFRAVHHDYPEAMLAHYWRSGIPADDAVIQIALGAEP